MLSLNVLHFKCVQLIKYLSRANNYFHIHLTEI